MRYYCTCAVSPNPKVMSDWFDVCNTTLISKKALKLQHSATPAMDVLHSRAASPNPAASPNASLGQLKVQTGVDGQHALGQPMPARSPNQG